MSTIVEAVNLKKTCMLGKVSVNALRAVTLRVARSDFIAVLGARVDTILRLRLPL